MFSKLTGAAAQDDPSSSHQALWWKALWQPQVPPKVRIFWWRAIDNYLLIKAELKGWHIEGEFRPCLWSSGGRSISHWCAVPSREAINSGRRQIQSQDVSYPTRAQYHGLVIFSQQMCAPRLMQLSSFVELSHCGMEETTGSMDAKAGTPQRPPIIFLRWLRP